MTFKHGLMAGITALALCIGASRAEARSMVFTSWGGTTQDAQKKFWAEPFAKETGIKVLEDGPTDYGKLKAMVDSGNVSWDVVDVEYDFAVKAAKDGLLTPIDYSIVKRSDIDPRFATADSVGSFYYSFVLGYNKSAFKGKTPKTWAALFDLKDFPGKRTFYKWSAPGVLEIALLADGVPPDKLYPLDLDRAFKKLDSIKSQIIWWSTGAQSQQLMASGEAPIGMFWNGRLHALQDTGVPVGISWQQNLTTADMLVVPKGSKHVADAMKFIAFATSAKPQAQMATDTGYAPINVNSKKLMTTAARDTLPDEHATTHIDLNMQYWAAHRDEIARRWYAWQTK